MDIFQREFINFLKEVKYDRGTGNKVTWKNSISKI